MTESSLRALADLIGIHPLFILAAIIWTLAWKGFALWRAAELKQKYWFLALLLINTLGVLEIVYLFVVARNYKVEVIES